MPSNVRSELKITFCNVAYARTWLKHLHRYHGKYYPILRAILEEIRMKDGGDISKNDIYARYDEVEKLVRESGFDIIPSKGQALTRNGNGIRHAKFSPSKQIAIIWEKIGETIYVTFDDHAPVQYHRAIRHLRDIRLGRPAYPARPRNTARFMRKLRIHWKKKYARVLHGINLASRYYE